MMEHGAIRNLDDVESLEQIIAQQKQHNDALRRQNAEMLRVLNYAASQALSPNFNVGNWIDMVMGLIGRIERNDL